MRLLNCDFSRLRLACHMTSILIYLYGCEGTFLKINITNYIILENFIIFFSFEIIVRNNDVINQYFYFYVNSNYLGNRLLKLLFFVRVSNRFSIEKVSI